MSYLTLFGPQCPPMTSIKQYFSSLFHLRYYNRWAAAAILFLLIATILFIYAASSDDYAVYYIRSQSSSSSSSSSLPQFSSAEVSVGPFSIALRIYALSNSFPYLALDIRTYIDDSCDTGFHFDTYSNQTQHTNEDASNKTIYDCDSWNAFRGSLVIAIILGGLSLLCMFAGLVRIWILGSISQASQHNYKINSRISFGSIHFQLLALIGSGLSSGFGVLSFIAFANDLDQFMKLSAIEQEKQSLMGYPVPDELELVETYGRGFTIAILACLFVLLGFGAFWVVYRTTKLNMVGEEDGEGRGARLPVYNDLQMQRMGDIDGNEI